MANALRERCAHPPPPQSLNDTEGREHARNFVCNNSLIHVFFLALRRVTTPRVALQVKVQRVCVWRVVVFLWELQYSVIMLKRFYVLCAMTTIKRSNTASGLPTKKRAVILERTSPRPAESDEEGNETVSGGLHWRMSRATTRFCPLLQDTRGFSVRVPECDTRRPSRPTMSRTFLIKSEPRARSPPPSRLHPLRPAFARTAPHRAGHTANLGLVRMGNRPLFVLTRIVRSVQVKEVHAAQHLALQPGVYTSSLISST